MLGSSPATSHGLRLHRSLNDSLHWGFLCTSPILLYCAPRCYFGRSPDVLFFFFFLLLFYFCLYYGVWFLSFCCLSSAVHGSLFVIPTPRVDPAKNKRELRSVFVHDYQF